MTHGIILRKVGGDLTKRKQTFYQTQFLSMSAVHTNKEGKQEQMFIYRRLVAASDQTETFSQTDFFFRSVTHPAKEGRGRRPADFWPNGDFFPDRFLLQAGGKTETDFSPTDDNSEGWRLPGWNAVHPSCHRNRREQTFSDVQGAALFQAPIKTHGRTNDGIFVHEFGPKTAAP